MHRTTAALIAFAAAFAAIPCAPSVALAPSGEREKPAAEASAPSTGSTGQAPENRTKNHHPKSGDAHPIAPRGVSPERPTETDSKKPLIVESRATGDPDLVCLMYHRFVPDVEYAALTRAQQVYTVSESRFEAHLRMIAASGRDVMSLEEALASVRSDPHRPERPSVLITIDDGCRSALTIAAPLLRKYGMTATLFVTTDPAACVFHTGCGGDTIGIADPRMTNNQLLQWATMGFDVGAHGLTHRPLSELTDSQLKHELSAPREALETLLGRPITALAAPRGRWDDRVQRFARNAGYEAMFTSERGMAFENSDELALRRFNLSGRWHDAKIRRLLNRAGAEPPITRHPRTKAAGRRPEEDVN